MLPAPFSRLTVDRKANSFARFSRMLSRPMRFLPLRSGLKSCWNCDGQTLVETAICVSVLLTVTFGIMGAGLALYTYNIVCEAARDGSRYAMVHGSSCSGCVATNASVQSYVRGLGYPAVSASNLSVNATWPDSGTSCTPSVSPCDNPGNNVMVTVTYQLPWSIPFMPSSTLSLTSTSEVIIAQ
jgi:Flp pilus assembly protein TadG